MQLIVVDISPPLRAALVGRVQEAVRQAGLPLIAAVEIDPGSIESVNWERSIGCFVGPGCGPKLREVLTRLQSAAGTCPIAVVLDTETYAREAIAVYKILARPVLSETDLAQLGSFVVDCERQAAGRPVGLKHRHVFAVTQLKGGVGATSVTAAIGSYFASIGTRTVLVDFDDVAGTLTEWARVGARERALVGELLRTGGLSVERLREIVVPVEGSGGNLSAVGIPLLYNEAFHLKSYVLDGAPSSSEFVSALMSLLLTDFDVVLVDMSRAWGVASFALLPWCERVMLVTDDDGLSLRRTLDALARLRQESGDPEEFNLSKWILIVNRYSGSRLPLSAIHETVSEMELFRKDTPILAVHESSTGRMWGAPGRSMYEVGDRKLRKHIEAIGAMLVPSVVSHTESKGVFGALFGR